MKNLNTVIFNSDLTVKEQSEKPIQAFSSYQNIVRAIAPFGTEYIPFAIFHATNNANDVSVPAQFILMLPNGTLTVDGEQYYVYEQKVPEAIVGSLRANKIEFVLSLWGKQDNFIGVQRYDETAQGYNDTTYIAAQLLTDFPNAEEDDYVRVFNTETDWQYDGTVWTDTNDQFESVLEDYRSEVVEFALYRGKSTGKPTHKPSNTESIIDAINLKVSKSGDIITGALQFANANQTRLILGDNNITTDGQINATTFDNGDNVSDAVKFSDLATLFDVTASTPVNPDNWLDAYATVIQAKFDEYIKSVDIGITFLLTDGSSTMTGNLNMGNQDIVSVGNVDGVDVSQLKTDFDTHNHTESDITDLDKYTQSEVDGFLSGKANTSHTHVEADITDLDKYTQSAADTKFMDKDTYTDVNDKIKLSKLPDAAKSQTFVQESTDPKPTEGILAGDKLYETDTGDSYIYDGTDWVLMADADWENVNLDWGNVTGTPTTISGYGITDAYTKTETDDLLDDKSDVGHTHTESDITDLDKYTQTQVDNLLDGKSDVGHTHVEADITDLDKYTVSQVDTLLTGKMDTDGVNSALGVLNFNGSTTNGTVEYDNDRQILTFDTTDGTSLNIGGELWFVNAKTNDALVNGDLVQFAGSQGDHYLVKKLVGSEIVTNPDYFVGVATHDANANDYVKVTWFGEVDGVDTNGYTVGDILYIDTVNSTLTNVEPTTQPIIQVAAITKEENAPAANDGRILVRPQFKSRSAAEVFVAEVAGKLNANNLQDTLVALYDKTQAHEDLTNNPHSVTAADVAAIPTSEKGVANGVATLDANGIVPISQLPFALDDVLQGYLDSGVFYEEVGLTTVIEAAEDKLYIDIPTNSLYRYDGSSYIAVIEVADIVNLDSIPDVDTTGKLDGWVLKYNATSTKWEANDNKLGGLNDVDVASATNGQYLTYDNATSKWVATTLPTFSTTLADLDDTTITTPVADDFLVHDGTDWKNRAISKTDVDLNNVQNYGIASQAEAEAGTLDTKYMTPLKTKQYVDEATIDGGTF